MIKYVEQFAFSMGVKSHERGERKIDNEDSKSYGKQEQRLILLSNGKVNEEKANGPHNDKFIVEIKKPGLRVQDIEQYVNKRVPTHRLFPSPPYSYPN